MNRILVACALLLACDPQTEVDEPEVARAEALGNDEDHVDSVSRVPDMQVHWIYLPSFAELVGHSQLVVRAEVVGTSYDAIRHHDVENPRVYQDLPLTISSLAVKEVLRSTTEEIGAESLMIEVQEIGGRTDSGSLVYPHDKPPLVRGNDLILFLQANPAVPGRYSVVGGTQGRFTVVGDKIEPLYTGREFADYDGEPLDKFVAEIRSFERPRP